MTFSPEKLKALLAERGLTPYAADMACGFIRKSGVRKGWAMGHVERWCRGASTPSGPAAATLAATLGVPIEALYDAPEKK